MRLRFTRSMPRAGLRVAPRQELQRTIPRMASDPPPPQPAAPPPEPGPGASRDEWRRWRHQQRDQWRAQGHPGGWYGPGPWNWWGGGWFWGVALVVVGAYLLLQNLGLLASIRGDILWPVLLILFGVYLVFRRGRWWRP